MKAAAPAYRLEKLGGKYLLKLESCKQYVLGTSIRQYCIFFNVGSQYTLLAWLTLQKC